MNADGKKVLVVGTGISGIAASELLVEKGVDTILYDSNEKLCEADIRARSEKLKNIPVILGQLSQDLMEQCSIAVLSPGVPIDLPLVGSLRERGVEIWGEIELAYRYARGRMAAITGTNGNVSGDFSGGRERRRKDDDDGAGRRDFKEPLRRCQGCRQYRHSLYVYGLTDDR